MTDARFLEQDVCFECGWVNDNAQDYGDDSKKSWCPTCQNDEHIRPVNITVVPSLTKVFEQRLAAINVAKELLGYLKGLPVAIREAAKTVTRNNRVKNSKIKKGTVSGLLSAAKTIEEHSDRWNNLSK